MDIIEIGFRPPARCDEPPGIPVGIGGQMNDRGFRDVGHRFLAGEVICPVPDILEQTSCGLPAGLGHGTGDPGHLVLRIIQAGPPDTGRCESFQSCARSGKSCIHASVIVHPSLSDRRSAPARQRGVRGARPVIMRSVASQGTMIVRKRKGCTVRSLPRLSGIMLLGLVCIMLINRVRPMRCATRPLG